MNRQKKYRLRRRLLCWYDAAKRELPWRRITDPYAIWVAETMLQQTQVATVLPYYRRFLQCFPTLSALDRAALSRVRTVWGGLGYYRRAQNLKRAARIVMRQHDGALPRDFNALLKLPGVGPYTAGALMSIAFNEPYPALDGNVRRVYVRLLGAQTEQDIRRLAARMVSGSRPGDFNQALMELGATVCLPGKPSCETCPVASCCSARKNGHITTVIRRRRAQHEVEWPLLLIHRDRRVLLRRRSGDGLLAGFWEVPGGPRRKNESPRAAVARDFPGFEKDNRSASPVGTIRHAITDKKIRAPLFVVSCPEPVRPPPGWRWVKLSSLPRYPLSALSLKAIILAKPYL